MVSAFCMENWHPKTRCMHGRVPHHRVSSKFCLPGAIRFSIYLHGQMDLQELTDDTIKAVWKKMKQSTTWRDWRNMSLAMKPHREKYKEDLTSWKMELFVWIAACTPDRMDIASFARCTQAQGVKKVIETCKKARNENTKWGQAGNYEMWDTGRL